MQPRVSASTCSSSRSAAARDSKRQREFVDIGGLASYGSDLSRQFRGAAGYVDGILKGASLDQASTFEYVVNRQTARELGIVVPQSLLLRPQVVP